MRLKVLEAVRKGVIFSLAYLEEIFYLFHYDCNWTRTRSKGFSCQYNLTLLSKVKERKVEIHTLYVKKNYDVFRWLNLGIEEHTLSYCSESLDLSPLLISVR